MRVLLIAMMALGCAVFSQQVYSSGRGTGLRSMGNGVYRFTARAGNGWPQVVFYVPPMEWGKDGKVRMTVRIVKPGADEFRSNIVVGSNSPKEALSGAGYVTERVTKEGKCVLEFGQAGDKSPQELFLALKNPEVDVELEIGPVTVGAYQYMPLKRKKRQEPIPPVVFKGKPFFPLGAYDTFRVGEGGKLGTIDPEFLAAGGNFADFGVLQFPECEKGQEKSYQRILAGLEKARNDRGFDNVALLIGMGSSLLFDGAKAKSGNLGMNEYWMEATGEALNARRKFMTEMTTKLATYPNVIGYTIDEPENSVWQYYSDKFKEDWAKNKDAGLAAKMNEWISWTTPIIRKHHPSAKLMPIIAWWSTYDYTASLYDVLIANTYPAKKPGMHEFEAKMYTVAYDAAKQVSAVRKNGGGRSAIFMPSMFDNLKGSIPLTINEQLYAMFAPIACGVMGIHGWRLQRCSDAHRKFVIYPAMREVHELREFFLGEWHDELVASDHDTAGADYLREFRERIRLVEGMEDAKTLQVIDVVPDVVHCLRRRVDGKWLLLAVSNRREPIDVTFELDVENLPRFMVDNINKSCKVWFKANSAFVHFEPFGVHAFVF